MSRMTRIGSGTGLVLLGGAMLVLPGPGILTIAAGLTVLSTEYDWAADTLDWVKGKYRRYLTADEAPSQE